MTKQTRSPAELRDMFGANLRLMAERYPSISELSRRLGINRTQFNRYLSGESFPRPDVLDRICAFFGVDARILLEPVDSLSPRDEILNGAFLRDFFARGVNDISEDYFPSGFYRFSRRAFTSDTQFVVGIVHVHREERLTYVRGFEPREALRQQGLSAGPGAREFRGYAARHEDGITLMIARRGAMTCSFNFLSRIASYENNFWVGYVTRTVAENPTGQRVVRMVYEHLPSKATTILPAARSSGFASETDLLPYHRRLLRLAEPFR